MLSRPVEDKRLATVGEKFIEITLARWRITREESVSRKNKIIQLKSEDVRSE